MCFASTDIVPSDTAETTMSLVKQAVRWAWDTDGNDADIDTVYRYLSQFPGYAGDEFDGYTEQDIAIFRTAAQTLAYNLKDFTSGQAFGRWFNGKSNFDISTDEFVVLELEHLKPQKELFKIITLQVINAVTQDLYLSDRSKNRMIIFDEAWQFIRNENNSGGGARTDNAHEGRHRRRLQAREKIRRELHNHHAEHPRPQAVRVGWRRHSRQQRLQILPGEPGFRDGQVRETYRLR